MQTEDLLSTTELSKSLDVEQVAAVVRRGGLRWFGHLERKGNEDWVSACRKYEVGSAVGKRGKGRPRKTLEECVASTGFEERIGTG